MVRGGLCPLFYIEANMDLTVKNVEKYFNILNNSKIQNTTLFDIILMTVFEEKELEDIQRDDDITKQMVENDKVFKQRYVLYYFIEQCYKDLANAYKTDFSIDIDESQLKEFTEKIKTIYKRVDYIEKALDRIRSEFRNKALMNNENGQKQRNMQMNEINACNKQIEDDKTKFLHRMIELGLAKSAIKKHLYTEPSELHLKDFFDRYFVLKCNGVLNG